MEAVVKFRDLSLKLINDFLKTDKGELSLLGKLVKIIVIYIVVKFLVRLGQKILDRAFKKRLKYAAETDENKITTVKNVLKSILKVAIYFVGITTILEVFHVNTSSIIATAGIGGLAIGFGAQSLVKDVITGSFILFEDQYSIGDHVSIKGYEGVVEELGLRLTKVRDLNGELHIIPNGEISIVTNKSRGNIISLIKFTVGYDEDLDRVISLLDKMCKNCKAEKLVERPMILGVSDLGASGVEIVLRIVSQPLNQYQDARDMKKLIKDSLDKEDIEIPYSKIVVLNGEK